LGTVPRTRAADLKPVSASIVLLYYSAVQVSETSPLLGGEIARSLSIAAWEKTGIN
jgi:hypothetical protein